MVGTIILLLVIICLLLGMIFFFTPNKQNQNPKPTEETTDWEYEKNQAKREHEAEKNKEWFKAGRWLTDKEIDWAVERIEKINQMPGSFPGEEVPSKFKVLPAHQFHLAREAKREDDPLIFKELLTELTNFKGELIFIPVNNPNFHWSLLVYKTKSKKFYHYDTLRGANWNYIKNTVYELLNSLKIPNHLTGQHFLARHKIRQNNGSNCGVAVIAIIRRIREKYQGNSLVNLENIQLGGFDFGQERNYWRERYLKESKN